MNILNPKNETIGTVSQDVENSKNVPFHYRYYGYNKVTFPIHADSESAACVKACKFFGKGYFYLLFTI